MYEAEEAQPELIPADDDGGAGSGRAVTPACNRKDSEEIRRSYTIHLHASRQPAANHHEEEVTAIDSGRRRYNM